MRDYEINSDLKQSKFESLKFVQGDTGSKIIVNLFEDSQAVNLSNCTVLAKYKRSDGYTDNKEATVTDNTITVEIDNTMTATAGVLKLVFEITYETTKKVSTFMLLADISEGIGAKSTTGGGTGDVVVDVDLSNYYTKSEVNSLLNNIANELGVDENGEAIALETTAQDIRPAINELKTNIDSVGSPTDEQVTNAINSAIEQGLITGSGTKTSVTSSDTFSIGTSSDSGGGSEEGGGDTTVTTYNIVNTLTNCVNSNTAISIEENTSYTGTISANEGYTLGSITVTMGGADITSTAVNGSYISIPFVTGDVVVTAIANETFNLSKYLKTEGYSVSVRRSDYPNILRFTSNSNYNVYSIPVKKDVTYKMTMTKSTTSGTSNAYWEANKTMNANTIDLLPSCNKDITIGQNTDITSGITLTAAKSYEYKGYVNQGDGNNLFTAEIVFAEDGYLIFGCNPTYNQQLVEVI